MIRHIVCFKLKDNNQELCEKTKDILLSMRENVSLVRDISVGVDFLHSARSFDIILQVDLDDEKALADYQEDKYHVDVVKTHMHSVTEKSIAIDYYI
ncbi:MAG: Dabb family protein [Ruminococcaceae bacterium]|nr:Dabb family protein [Oscillospiraceae bacterium]